MLREGFSLEGLEDVLNWKVKPVIDGKTIKLALYDNNGKELIKHNPLAVEISSKDAHGKEVIPALFADLTETIKEQTGMTLKQFLVHRSDYRNKLLYASDAGTMSMAETLSQLIDVFKKTYHDLLWVLALLLGSKPPSKEWGV